jgi:hypothetical protein
MGVKQEIRESKDFKKFKKIVANVQAKLNVEKDANEARSLHAGRTSRKLYGDKRYSPKAILDAAMNDMAARSRLVELRVQTTNQIDVLGDACKAMRNSISTNFGETVKKRFTTVGDRGAFYDTMISDALEIQAEGEALIKMLDNLIADIDKSSFALKHVVDCLSLLSGSKAGSVI